MDYSKAEEKEWARTYFRGSEATILPSFTPGEAAVRHDVKELIRHWFFCNHRKIK